MWFSKGKFLARDTQLRGFGCGIVALLDFCVYMGELPASNDRNEYMERIRSLGRVMPIFPGLGIAPYYYPLLANLFFRKNRIPYRLHGMISLQGKKGLEKAMELLRNDTPVIFAAGPTIPFLFRKKSIPLYTEKYADSGKSVRAHYMTLLGLEEHGGETWMKVASWGEIYLIRLSDYRRHTAYAFPFTNRFYGVKSISR